MRHFIISWQTNTKTSPMRLGPGGTWWSGGPQWGRPCVVEWHGHSAAHWCRARHLQDLEHVWSFLMQRHCVGETAGLLQNYNNSYGCFYYACKHIHNVPAIYITDTWGVLVNQELVHEKLTYCELYSIFGYSSFRKHQRVSNHTISQNNVKLTGVSFILIIKWGHDPDRCTSNTTKAALKSKEWIENNRKINLVSI